MRLMKLIMLIGLAQLISGVVFAKDLSEIFSEGVVNGNIRAYYNTRDYPDSRTDEAGFALGGALRAETGTWGESGWGKLGVGFYTAQDLNLNSNDTAKVNKRLGDGLEVLGEAYTQFLFSESKLTFGRQLYSTPFANAGDAFIAPFTFQGIGFKSSSFTNMTVDAGLIRQFKNRNSDDFVNVGTWTTNRLGATPTDTDGVMYLGLTYAPKNVNVQAWYYDFMDIYSMVYLQGNYNFSSSGEIKPFVGLQYGTQSDAGDALAGAVDSSLLGLQAGAGVGKATITFAYNTVSENENVYGNGAFLAPFSYATSVIFTNSMLETLENADSGDAFKMTLNYNFTSKFKFKVSYASLDFNNIVDRDDIDIDLTYSFDGPLKGLSIRSRTTIVNADVESVEQINNRFQLQYTY